ncbi:MAG: hypothetical protein ACSHW9_01765 [Salinibacterium amurskyense]
MSAAVGALVVLATVGDVDDIVRAHQVQELRGLSTLSITAVDGETLSATACDAINEVDVVNAAGGAIRTEVIQPSNSTAPVTIRYTTPEYIAVAYPGSARGLSSIAGAELVGEIGAVAGGTIVDSSSISPHKPVILDAVAGSRSRIDGINRDVLIASAPVGNVSECLVDVSYGQADLMATVVPTFFSSPVVVRSFLPTDSVDRNPALELDTRWSGFLWLGGGLGLVLFAAFVWWSRRHETALYRLLGFDRRSVGFIVALETVLVTIIPAQLASSWAIGFVPIDGGAVTYAAVAADSARLSLLLTAGPSIAIALSVSGSIVDRLKGR